MKQPLIGIMVLGGSSWLVPCSKKTLVLRLASYFATRSPVRQCLVVIYSANQRRRVLLDLQSLLASSSYSLLVLPYLLRSALSPRLLLGACIVTVQPSALPTSPPFHRANRLSTPRPGNTRRLARPALMKLLESI